MQHNSHRARQFFSKFRESAPMKEALSKFDVAEIAVLQKIFQDVARRSPGKTVDKETFLNLFPLPGLIG